MGSAPAFQASLPRIVYYLEKCTAAVQIDWGEVYILTGVLDCSNWLMILNGAEAKSPSLLSGREPPTSAQFPWRVLLLLNVDRPGALFSRLRGSSPPSDRRAHLVSRIKIAWARESAATPFAFEEWRRFLVGARLSEAIDFQIGTGTEQSDCVRLPRSC